MQDIKLLQDYIDLIQDDVIRKELYRLMQKTEVQAAFSKGSTYAGSNHPQDENMAYGLLKHTLRVANLAIQLLRSYPNMASLDFDIIIASAILHDIPYKFKSNGFTNLRHAYDNAVWFSQNTKLPEDKKTPIISCILYHMGRWDNTNNSDKDSITPTLHGWILHLADNIASRKNINVNIDCVDYLKENLQ